MSSSRACTTRSISAAWRMPRRSWSTTAATRRLPPSSIAAPSATRSNQLVAQSTPKTFMCPSARFVPGVRKEQKDYGMNGGPTGCCPERNNGIQRHAHRRRQRAQRHSPGRNHRRHQQHVSVSGSSPFQEPKLACADSRDRTTSCGSIIRRRDTFRAEFQQPAQSTQRHAVQHPRPGQRAPQRRAGHLCRRPRLLASPTTSISSTSICPPIPAPAASPPAARPPPTRLLLLHDTRSSHHGLSDVATVCIAAFVLGCGRGGPEVVPIEGTVTHNGEPVPNVRIYFVPTDGRPSWAISDASGPFRPRLRHPITTARKSARTRSGVLDEGGRSIDPTVAMSGAAPSQTLLRDDARSSTSTASEKRRTLEVEVKKADRNFQLKLD